jgi:hypothetical protein
MALYYSSVPANNGEFEIISASGFSFTYYNQAGAVDLTYSGTYHIVGNKAVIADNNFYNYSIRNDTTCTYTGLSKRIELPLSLGKALHSTEEIGSPDDAEGSLDVIDSGWIFKNPSFAQGPVWSLVAGGAGAAPYTVLFAPQLSTKVLLRSIHIEGKRTYGGASLTVVATLKKSNQGILTTVISNFVTVAPGASYNLDIGGLNFKPLKGAIYTIEVETTTTDVGATSPLFITAAYLIIDDPETNQVSIL